MNTTVSEPAPGARAARFGDWLHVFDRTVPAVFVVEPPWRFFVYRSRFFRDPWCAFDFVIVGIALMPASSASCC